jgi:hypothetical protein
MSIQRAAFFDLLLRIATRMPRRGYLMSGNEAIDNLRGLSVRARLAVEPARE